MLCRVGALAGTIASHRLMHLGVLGGLAEVPVVGEDVLDCSGLVQACLAKWCNMADVPVAVTDQLTAQARARDAARDAPWVDVDQRQVVGIQPATLKVDTATQLGQVQQGTPCSAAKAWQGGEPGSARERQGVRPECVML